MTQSRTKHTALLLAFALIAISLLTAAPVRAGELPDLPAQFWLKGNAPENTCWAALHGQVGDCTLIIHAGASVPTVGETVTLKVWEDDSKANLIDEDSAEFLGELLYLGQLGGLEAGNYVEVTIAAGTYTGTAPAASATVDVVNDVVTGTADGQPNLFVIPAASFTAPDPQTVPFVCMRSPEVDEGGNWSVDYSTDEWAAEDEPPGCSVTVKDLKPGDWLQIPIRETGTNGLGFELSVWIPTFPDTDPGSTHAENIAQMYNEGITFGCDDDGNYCPTEAVNRAQMATFIARALDLTPVGPNPFSDVSDGGTHTPNIIAVAEAGITFGCNSEGTAFCPDEIISREQMASFLARAFGLTPVGENPFGDVANSGAHTPNIIAVAEAGITFGCNSEGTEYCPNDDVNRAQMASFIIRAINLP